MEAKAPISEIGEACLCISDYSPMSSAILPSSHHSSKDRSAIRQVLLKSNLARRIVALSVELSEI